MAGIKKLFADAAKLLYLGVGISDPGTIPRKIDLWKIADGNGWKLFNLSASNLQHKGKEAIQLESSGEGFALFEALEFPVGKLDLSIAAVNQTVGLVVRAVNQNRYDLVSFDVEVKPAKPTLTIRIGSRSATSELPAHLIGEWINVRTVVDTLFTAVFIDGKNMPDLKVPTDEHTGSGDFIGLWTSGNSSALVADLKYIQTKKRDFE
ncbi:MAG: hypothetical protein ACKVZH_02865 [Blastocatellia bacterium]